MIITCLTTLLFFLIVYLRNVYSRFSKYGVSCFMPIPVLGNVGNITLRRWHIAEDIQNLYKAFPNDRFVGRFELMRPVLLIRDLELIKQVTVKDYEYFIDHRTIVDESIDPLFGRNLFSLRDQEWKDMRSSLSPIFTSSKIRGMVPLVIDNCDVMINLIRKRIAESESGYIDIECKELTSRLSSDVIASCAFGVKVGSQTNFDDEFYSNCKDSGNFNFRRILVYLAYASFPSIAKRMNVKYLSDKSSSFFKDLFTNAITERETKNIFRPDMIHLLKEAKKAWSDNDLVAQAMLFLFAGFETVSSAMSFLLHELAVNPDIQERLLEEIREDARKNRGEICLASLQSMKYLDMVISETLRLWPPAVGMDRTCVKDYNMGIPNDKTDQNFILRKGESIQIPVWAIHRDSNYFPNPNKFDPERFSQENGAKIKPFSYLPFGSGPRNCIGTRFALCEVKVMVYRLLQQLELSPCEKTSIPAKIAADTFSLHIQGGHWVRFRIRTEQK